MKNIQQLIDFIKAEKADADKKVNYHSERGYQRMKDYSEGRAGALAFILAKVELLVKNDTEASNQKAAILQTPCRAKFASEANELHRIKSHGCFWVQPQP